MGIKVEITSKCTIAPSSAAPPQLNLHKLSRQDQLMVPSYIPIILFYNNSGSSAAEAELFPSLKRSLAQALALFRPLAGKLTHNSHIDCNGHGCLFVEATAASSVAEFLAQSQPDVHFLSQLLPFAQPRTSADITDENPLLALQVTAFSCGGIALGACINHKIADAHTLFSFLAAWADAANGRDARNLPSFDSATYFPPIKEPAGSDATIYFQENSRVTKRFVFEESSITVLRQNLGLSASTRFEAVAALIWHCFLRARSVPFRASVAIVSVNMRRRVQQIPDNLFGNSTASVVAAAPDQDDMSTASDIRLMLAKELRGAVRRVDHDFVRRLREVDEPPVWQEAVEEAAGASDGEKEIKVGDIIARGGNMYLFTSWLGFPYYEVDFGFGRPVWVASKYIMGDMALLMERAEERGVEAWISLREEEMDKFVSDADIVSYAKF